jgi:hypothetical protein
MSTHSSKAKSGQVKTTIKETNFFVFLIKTMQVKINKVKAKLKQSKGCACETPLAEVFIFPGNGARKLLLVAAVLM